MEHLTTLSGRGPGIFSAAGELLGLSCIAVYNLPKSFGFAFTTTQAGCSPQMGAAPDSRRHRSHTVLGDLWHHLEGFSSCRGWCSLPALQSHPSAGTLPFHDPSQLLPQHTMGMVVFPLTVVLIGLGNRRLAVPLCHRQPWNSSSSCSKAASLLLTSREWFLLGMGW